MAVGNVEVVCYDRWVEVEHAAVWPCQTPIVGMRGHVFKMDTRLWMTIGGPVTIAQRWELTNSMPAAEFVDTLNRTAEAAEDEVATNPTLWPRIRELTQAIWDDGELLALQAERERIMKFAWDGHE